jgi:hypothetical protein
MGKDVNGAPITQTFKSHDGITGTDVVGANLILASGRGTGAGAVSSLIFQTPTVLTTGTTAQTLATRLTLTETMATHATPVTITETVGTSGLTITGATQTANFPALSITQTWNDPGATIGFTALKVNATNTSSNVASFIADFQLAGASLFAVRRDGVILFNNQTRLISDGTNILAQRNSTNSQKFRIYNSFSVVNTSAEWFKMDWQTTANQFRFGTVGLGGSYVPRPASWDYGGTEASPVAAITVPITSGAIVFGGDVAVPDEAYGSGWNGSVNVPTKNAVYDKIETLFTTPGAWASWTPSWTGLVIGNAVVTAKYTQIGKLVVCRLHVVFGNTSTFSGGFTASLPVTSVSYDGTGTAQNIGTSSFYDTSAGSVFTGVIVWASTTTIAFRTSLASLVTGTVIQNNVGNTVPMTWTNPDEINCTFMYEAS